jgi:hypothetical protein
MNFIICRIHHTIMPQHEQDVNIKSYIWLGKTFLKTYLIKDLGGQGHTDGLGASVMSSNYWWMTCSSKGQQRLTMRRPLLELFPENCNVSKTIYMEIYRCLQEACALKCSNLKKSDTAVPPWQSTSSLESVSTGATGLEWYDCASMTCLLSRSSLC